VVAFPDDELPQAQELGAVVRVVQHFYSMTYPMFVYIGVASSHLVVVGVVAVLVVHSEKQQDWDSMGAVIPSYNFKLL
jgi:hypothetical protein